MTDYAAHRQRTARRQRELSEKGRDLPPLPPVADPARRAACAKDLAAFAKTYLAQTFTLPWSADHLLAIERIQRATLEGGTFALAMPRGSGKTSLALAAALWCILYGHRPYTVLIAATTRAAQQLLTHLKDELETNPLLAEDFPEVCLPVRALAGIVNRQAGQTYLGRRTRLFWGRDQVVLPSLPGSPAAGARLAARGLGAAIRGLVARLPDGKTIRPTLAIIDDPQTDQTAKSPTQTQRRLDLLCGAVLGLAGPGQKMAAVMPCTVIRPGDLADTLLDNSKHPEWHGLRTRLVRRWPENDKLWQQYAAIRADCLRTGRDPAEATDFYREHREQMDKGAEISWPQRYNPDELSAIQHAYNLRLDLGEEAFNAEYQNDPAPLDQPEAEAIDQQTLVQRLNRVPKGTVPAECLRLTAFVDVHQKLLFWLVAAWDQSFGGAVVDYGTWPEQRRQDFTLRNARYTLAHKTPRAGLEGAIYAGLEALAERLLAAEWPRQDSGTARIERCLIDANWGQATELVLRFCRQSRYAGLILPSFGRAIGPHQRPMTEWRRQPGDRIGWHWLLRAGRLGRHVLFDTNHWKTFVRNRLTQPLGDPGAVTLFGNSPGRHRLLSTHLCAETSTATEGRGRRVEVWQQRPDHPDNHWWDCLVGCAVAASIQGTALPGHLRPTGRRRARLKYLDT